MTEKPSDELAGGGGGAGASAPARSEEVEPFLRGCVWPATEGVPYPRAKPEGAMGRLPRDTWMMASIPAGVRLELVGDAPEIEVGYHCAHASFGYLGGGECHSFVVWRGDERVADVDAVEGTSTVRLPGPAGERAVVHLPERMGPTVLSLSGVGGSISPAPAQPRWLCYGDSIAEGWVVTTPDRAWPAVVGRSFGLDAVNLGYAGSARGEIASAEELAELEADVITICHGTNCWTRTPHSASLFASGLQDFLTIVRQGHPDTPIVAVSPITRPDAESSPNRLGTTLVDLRSAFEAVVLELQADDPNLTLVEGFPLVTVEQLADGIHPGDDGHAAMAAAIGPVVAAAVG
ncbi:MAG TPA: GDSL-type esterase/lipase family protein [Acidimicrobiales bacterium]|nr:GDSL-type esterase/lipase family protein [Acidimicrobiales bacterium]